jgi:hypothetical protein
MSKNTTIQSEKKQNCPRLFDFGSHQLFRALEHGLAVIFIVQWHESGLLKKPLCAIPASRERTMRTGKDPLAFCFELPLRRSSFVFSMMFRISHFGLVSAGRSQPELKNMIVTRRLSHTLLLQGHKISLRLIYSTQAAYFSMRRVGLPRILILSVCLPQNRSA